MTPSASFLNTTYGGYLHRDVPPEDAELTHVGPGTPAGEWLRRFWHPVFATDELKNLPKAIRILGEDLVLFRDRSGQVGLLELHCSHRGTSLEFGQIEERGIRCCYHAWLYDVDGKILDTPGEPADSTLKHRLHHGAYPTHEYKGLVFAYMGPPEKRPAFPVYDTYHMPGYQSQARMHGIWPCNWLQANENSHDPVHLLFLHALPGNEGFTGDLSEPPESDFMESPLGMACVDTWRSGDRVLVQVGDYIPPNLHLGCDISKDVAQRDLDQIGRTILSQWFVPVDDTHMQRFDIWYARECEEIFTGEFTYGQKPGSYDERQRVPGDYDSQVSQRPIAVHDLEHLGNTDLGVIMGRHIMRRGIEAVRNGEDPPGIGWKEGEIIPTYTHERALIAPLAPTPREDRLLLRNTGRRVVQDYIKELSKRQPQLIRRPTNGDDTPDEEAS